MSHWSGEPLADDAFAVPSQLHRPTSLRAVRGAVPYHTPVSWTKGSCCEYLVVVAHTSSGACKITYEIRECSVTSILRTSAAAKGREYDSAMQGRVSVLSDLLNLAFCSFVI